ncbi:MAG: carboxymuconolactone decarboxylase family protein [Acidimicrobiales bacterium]
MTGDARVPMLDEAAAREAAGRAGVADPLAALNVFRLLLRRERLAKGVSDLLLSLLFGAKLDPRIRELIIMRVAWVTGSVYEWTQHWRIATDLGIPTDDVVAVRGGEEDYSGLGELERAALAAVDECLAGRRISDQVMATLRHHLTDDAVVELVAAIGAWSMVSMLLRSLDVPLEDGVGEWPPDNTEAHDLR